MKKLLALYALTLLFNTAKTQVNEYFYSDNEQKEGGKIFCHLKYQNTIIIGGRTFDKAKYQPCLICVDTTGTVLWNTAINDTSTYGGYYIYIPKMFLGKDGYIYAFCRDF